MPKNNLPDDFYGLLEEVFGSTVRHEAHDENDDRAKEVPQQREGETAAERHERMRAEEQERQRLIAEIRAEREEQRRRSAEKEQCRIAEERERREAARLEAIKREEEEKLAAEKERRKHVEEVTSMDLPLDYENAFAQDERADVRAESVGDALVLSLRELGRVDIEYISQVCGLPIKDCIEGLASSVYQNPDTWGECFYKGYETADEYLSGNIVRKLRAASEADAKYSGYFSRNVEALKLAIPPAIPADDIYVTIGSPWLPEHVVADFICMLLGFRGGIVDRVRRSVVHDGITGSWSIQDKAELNPFGVRNTQVYGTQYINAVSIIEHTLNMQSIKVTREGPQSPFKKTASRVVDRDETVAALEKQQLILSKFREWVFKDADRRDELVKIYEDKYGCIAGRVYDGSFLTFPGMSELVKLYDYQRSAVAKIIFSPTTLLAHDVGSGKTYVMIAAGMEMRRMGISKKNVYAVPNNIVGQWRTIFKMLYPSAKLLVIDPPAFTPAKRHNVLEKLRDCDYDAVIIAYSCFDMIKMSYAYKKKDLEDKLAETSAALKKVAPKPAARLKSRDKKLRTELRNLIEKHDPNAAQEIAFDELGINTLFLDEAHNYKNLSIDSQSDNVLGINKNGSAKCNEMLDRVLCVQRQNGGRGAVFATGTPITNSVTDIYTMQRYLQSGELKFLGLLNFDNWAGMFGEKTTEFEIDVDTTNYRLATRFARFHNLPELTALFAQTAHFHKLDRQNGIPDFKGSTNKLIGRSDELAEYIQDISNRADAIRHGRVDRKTDNMLKVTTDGRKAALDIRLSKPNVGFSTQSKIYTCMETVYSIYEKTAAKAGTQLVFCDTSTPKPELNMYDEGRRILTSFGVPANEIAFIHDYETNDSREELFSDMRGGKVRILFGSTFKLGIGVNVQTRLIAIHHLDIPWRPADMVQREGRILRQGNTNEEVFIYRYITDGSFDAYSWQLLEGKQRFISQLLSGTMTDRSGTDIDDTVLSYAEVKALAIGNPLIKKRVEKANELSRLRALCKRDAENRVRMQAELAGLPERMENYRKLIGTITEDIGTVARADEIIKAEEAEEALRAAADRALAKAAEGAQSAAAKAEAEQPSAGRRRRTGAEILAALSNNVLLESETELMSYRGLRVILPKSMLAERPYIWLAGEGRYYVEIGESDVGCVNRMDNVIQSLPAKLKSHNSIAEELLHRRDDIRSELEKDENFEEQIAKLKAELSQIDKKLGVPTK